VSVGVEQGDDDDKLKGHFRWAIFFLPSQRHTATPLPKKTTTKSTHQIALSTEARVKGLNLDQVLGWWWFGDGRLWR
jgi:hypothetical protein